MQSIAYIPGSNGAGNANQMTVQTVRSPGASDILVNTVTGVPTKFYGSMGAPHTFTDPVTGETITIISEATAVDFAGHIDTGKIVIDAIAPGYVDTRGSLVGDIVVVRPVTEWANNLFNVLSQSLNDNGTIKESAVVYEPTMADFIQSGGVWTATTGLNASMTAIVAYQSGYRGTAAAIASRAFTASKDTYVDILRSTSNGTTTFSVVYTEVANGAAAPALAANSIRLAKVVTSGAAVTGVTQTGADGNTEASNMISPRGAIGTAQVQPKLYTGSNGWTMYINPGNGKKRYYRRGSWNHGAGVASGGFVYTGTGIAFPANTQVVVATVRATDQAISVTPRAVNSIDFVAQSHYAGAIPYGDYYYEVEEV